ncbi:LuxR C-terminal-related transcriptional regulator [Kribbella sp. VKM Ac-2568]|uniref:LuxR C-terminal-related transcriptional regulator n=1 Tax=Kribbella sp. VKM Ac-2568 TaxID=2512219 RepID=UPI001049FF67|nr:LuxR C-terminal-related transcriptional regulator [Kribbella sp. VKM Ac-2568]
MRRRLIELVSQGVQRPLTVVSAPAGFGKTMLLESWEALSKGPDLISWIALNATTDQPAALLESVVDGLHRRSATLSDEPVLFAPEDQPGQPTPTHLAVVEQQQLVLVVDCGDLTVTPAFGQTLHRLVHGNAGRVRIVLLTRSDPPVPLHLYRLAGTVAEIRAADLVFTTEEAGELMRLQNLDLAPTDLAVLLERTDGWPAGLMFAALTLAGKTDPARAIREFRGDTGNVSAYLMSEVLDAQPTALREFLLRTCIVDEVRPALAKALTGRPCDRRSLEFIAHGNSFIQPIPGTDESYSYQSLFREFLRAQLLFERPTLALALHHTAATWFAQNGQRLEAIQHAITARRWRDAARYLVEDLDFAGLLVGRQRRLLTTLFAGLPDDLEGAEAAIVRATSALAEFDVARSTSELRRARDWLDHDVSTPARASELAITVLQAVCASLGTDVNAGLDAVLAAEAALRAASGEPVIARPDLRLLMAGCKGRVLLQRGDFPAALAAFTEGVAIAETVGVHEALADFLGMSALVEAVWGHLRRASELAAHATALAESGAQPDEPQSAIVAQAWISTDRGELTEAQDLVHRAAEAAPTHDAHVLAAALALIRARLLRGGGETDLAGAELRAASNSYGSRHDGWLNQSLIVDEAKTLVAQHLPREAIKVIEHSPGRDQVGSLLVLRRAAIEAGERKPPLPRAATHRTVPLETQVDSWLVQAAESLRTGDSGRGGLCLERALRLAAPEQLRRPFTEAAPSVQRLLQPTGELVTRHPWLRAPDHLRAHDRAIGRSGHQLGHAPADVARVVPLTCKEHEVLEYLADLLTTEEIAATMYVSVNTVRSHVRSILRKLSASRRNEAVRRAWELGLLPARQPGLTQ